MLIREGNSITKHMKVDVYAEHESLPIMADSQTPGASTILQAELATTTGTNAIMFQLIQGIVVLVESKNDESMNADGGSQGRLTTEQVDPINKVMPKRTSQCTNNRNHQDGKTQVIYGSECFETIHMQSETCQFQLTNVYTTTYHT